MIKYLYGTSRPHDAIFTVPRFTTASQKLRSIALEQYLKTFYANVPADPEITSKRNPEIVDLSLGDSVNCVPVIIL